MTRPLTTLVLMPSLGGGYFGEVLAGLAREIASAGGRLVVVETLLASAARDVIGENGDFSTRVAWEQVDGVVSVSTAASAGYLKQLIAAGKPVVLLSRIATPDIPALVAQPDNHGGTVTAVEHLIGHGHTRIGFVGNLAQPDIRERLFAYQVVMRAHDLTADPALMFNTANNAESGGVAAGRALLGCSERPTAVMIATDRNALGLMRALSSAGLALPRDLAIVAFDNIAAGTFCTPSLSSVDPAFDEVGALAGRLVMARIRGDELPAGALAPEPAVLMVRESCGCDIDAQRSEFSRGDSLTVASPEHVSKRLQNVLLRELRNGDDAARSASYEATETTRREAMRLIELGESATTAQIQSFANSLESVASRPDTLRRFAETMMNFARGVGTSPGPLGGATAHVSSPLAAALWKLQAGASLQQAEVTDAAIVEQYVVDAGLLNTASSDPRDLTWLAGTRVTAACLALWEDGPSSGRLRIVGAYDAVRTHPDIVGTTLSSETFPPESLIRRAEAASRDVCAVVPVKNQDRDWGLLSVVAEIDRSTARENYQHWAALLCTALESQRLQEAVRRSALYDALTGLPNRELLVRQLTHALALWQRSRTPFAVLFLDLDGFKLVNDSLGHHTGDRVLKTVGADIQQHLRSVDTGARFGGDEFVILLSDTDAKGALVAAKRLQAALGVKRNLDGNEIVTQASIGIATSAVEYTSAEDVLRDADAAMYRAKSVEPGTVAFFDAPMRASSLSRRLLDTETHRALDDGQFEVHYQPIVNLVSGRTDRFEALVRWRHPERGLLAPDEFLPVMEETGLIVRLGAWILDEVCRQLVLWGPKVDNVSINVSDKEFWNEGLLTRVLDTVGRHHLAPERLTLEITEGVLMRHPDRALRLMQEMHEAGLRLHIDDFGTGHYSLETLHQYPVDAFKIDRSFINTLTTADNSAEVTTALVKLGKALGIAVVAEGVETEEQLKFLQELGCATGQGHLFMPAVTGDRAKDMLGRSLHQYISGQAP